jgi:hypothetical protein
MRAISYIIADHVPKVILHAILPEGKYSGCFICLVGSRKFWVSHRLVEDRRTFQQDIGTESYLAPSIVCRLEDER